MSIQIIINKEPPKELLRVIKEYYEPEDINEVIIDANHKDIKDGQIAAFWPETRIVVIDLDRCIENRGWMGFGMMNIQTVWFNMLRAVFHELGHAIQLKRQPGLEKMVILTPQLEAEADTFATEMILEWSEKGGVIPKLEDFGWAGKKLKQMINTFYGHKELRSIIMEELEALEVNGVAELNYFAACNQKTFGKREYENLRDAIDNKDVGIKINNKRYIDPKGFFGFIIDENQAAQDRAVDEAYAHIQQDIDNPDFHGIPGTSGGPEENLPIELAMPEHLEKLKKGDI